MSGCGVSYYKNGNKKYVGVFKNSKPHGICYKFDKHGDHTYYGSFENGLRSGFGTSYSQGKKLYQGNFEND